MGASIQDSYGKREKGYLGGVANSNPVRMDQEVAGEELTIGKFVKYDATGLLNLAGVGAVAGVVAKSDVLKSGTIAAGENISLLRGGSTFVYCETACVKGAEVFVRHTVNGALEIGDVRNDIDVDKAAAVKAVFAETLTSAGLVEIEINL